ncbi:MAG TPA: DoxX family protein [Bacteroidia bacterium]
MEQIIQYKEEIASLIARVFLGLLFLFQGYDAVFNVKIRNVISTYRNDFEGKGMPGFIVVMASWFTTCTELLCGLFLILGLFTHVSLYLLGLNLLVAALGFGLTSPMWDTRHVLPRLILLLFLLLIPEAWNIFSLDNLISKL